MLFHQMYNTSDEGSAERSDCFNRLVSVQLWCGGEKLNDLTGDRDVLVGERNELCNEVQRGFSLITEICIRNDFCQSWLLYFNPQQCYFTVTHFTLLTVKIAFCGT